MNIEISTDRIISLIAAATCYVTPTSSLQLPFRIASPIVVFILHLPRRDRIVATRPLTDSILRLICVQGRNEHSTVQGLWDISYRGLS